MSYVGSNSMCVSCCEDKETLFHVCRDCTKAIQKALFEKGEIVLDYLEIRRMANQSDSNLTLALTDEQFEHREIALAVLKIRRRNKDAESS